MALKRRFWWIVGAVVLAGVVVAAMLLWASAGRDVPPTRARVYRDVSACLLTGGQGLADPVAAAAWQGMQDTSLRTAVQVSYLAATGAQTPGAAAPYLAGLAQRHCRIVVAAGDAAGGAVALDARRFPKVEFLVVGGSANGGNVTVLHVGGGTGGIRRGVAAAVDEATRA